MIIDMNQSPPFRPGFPYPLNSISQMKCLREINFIQAGTSYGMEIGKKSTDERSGMAAFIVVFVRFCAIF
jgi:hypothetical protein